MVVGAALAEASGNRQPDIEVDIFSKVGKGILGSVNHQGFIEGEVRIDGLSEDSNLQRVEVELREPIELGYEERLYPLTREDTERLEGVTTDYFRLRGLGHTAADGASETSIGFMVDGTFYRGEMSDLAGVHPVSV